MTQLQRLEAMTKDYPHLKLVRYSGGRWVFSDGFKEVCTWAWFGTTTIKKDIAAKLVEGPQKGPLSPCKQ